MEIFLPDIPTFSEFERGKLSISCSALNFLRAATKEIGKLIYSQRGLKSCCDLSIFLLSLAHSSAAVIQSLNSALFLDGVLLRQVLLDRRLTEPSSARARRFRLTRAARYCSSSSNGINS
jgi:hypothetical protein